MHKTKALVLELGLQLVHFGALLLFSWFHLDFWHCHLIAAEKNEGFPCHTVLCEQKEKKKIIFQIMERCKKPTF